MRIEAIKPHGFCAGVAAAVAKAMAINDCIYAYHPVVHSEIVVDKLVRRGFKFVNSVDDVPSNSRVLVSAHGISPLEEKSLRNRSIEIIDATCPFVWRVHNAAAKFARDGRLVVIVGDDGHAEVEGIKGEVQAVDGAELLVVSHVEELIDIRFTREKIGIVAQTTVNQEVADNIVAFFLRKGFDVLYDVKVCNATKERQEAVKAFKGDGLLVLGSSTSANTMRLCSVSPCSNVFRASNIEELKKIDFSGINFLGVTSGASTPESFFREVLEYLGGVNE